MPQIFLTVNFQRTSQVYNAEYSCREDIFAVIISGVPSFLKKGRVIMSISSNIRQLRKKAGLTQIDLADKLEVSIATLRRWEAGETAPNGTRIIELANILGVSPDEVVAGADGTGQARLIMPASERSNGMLVFEGEGTRIELPPTDKGYELFGRLLEKLLERRNLIKPEGSSTGDPVMFRP